MKYRGGVGVHALLHDGHIHAVGPELQLLDGGCAEGVGSTEHDFLACELVLIGKFGDGGGFAHTVDSNHENHIGFVWEGGVEIFGEKAVVFAEQGGDFGPEDRVEFAGAYVFVAFDAFLQFVDDFESGFDPDVGGNQALFDIVENSVVDGGFAENGTGNLGEQALFGFIETGVEGLLFLFSTKQTHGDVCLNDETMNIEDRRVYLMPSLAFIEGRISLSKIWRYLSKGYRLLSPEAKYQSMTMRSLALW